MEALGEARFAQGDHGGLAKYIFEYHVFPEFMIVRREVLARTISSPCPFIFWAFLFTARALGQCDILFVPEPFARVTAISADPRTQQGNRETMFQWDHYRGGVEYLVSLAMRGSTAPLETRTATTEALNRRIAAYEPWPVTPQQLGEIGRMAGFATAAREAASFSAAPALVDPVIDQTLLNVLEPALRERLVPFRPDESGPAGPRAYLRLNPAFPAHVEPHDAVFDANEYMAQFA